MNNLAHTPATDPLLLQITALEEDGLHQIDPVQFRCIQSLAERASRQTGHGKTLLAERTTNAIERYRQQCKAALKAAKSLAEKAAQDFPDSATFLADTLTSGDLAALKRHITKLRYSHRVDTANRRALSGLTDQLLGHQHHDAASSEITLDQKLQQQESEACGQLTPERGRMHSTSELKSISAFRESWNKVHTHQLVENSVTQGPKDAGPLNPERLAIRSLSAMQKLSPQYLTRFVGYVETLLWLQQIDNRSRAESRKKTAK